jgi:hypothetical protein
VFSLHGGIGVWSYPTTAIPDNKSGPTVGASARVFNLGQTVFLHVYGAFSWTKLGRVGPFPDVKDTILQYGALLEVGIGRRLSLFGSFLRRGHSLRVTSDPSGQYSSLEQYVPDIAPSEWKPGIGIQYDFYVIPHGSIGIRAHVEQDMGLVALTMALEPQPRKKLSLNFDDE